MRPRSPPADPSHCLRGRICARDRVCSVQCRTHYDCQTLRRDLTCNLDAGVCVGHPLLDDAGTLMDVLRNDPGPNVDPVVAAPPLPDAGPTPIDGGTPTDSGTPTDRGPLPDTGTPSGCAIRELPEACNPGRDPGCDLVEVTMNFGLSCARFSDDSLRCWSQRTASPGFPGNGTTRGCGSPGLLRGLTGVRAFVQGERFGCAIRDGQPMPVWCWGDNSMAQLGRRGAEALVPTATTIPRGTMVLGDASGFAITAPGVVTVWGANGDGQLGDGTMDASGMGVLPHAVMFPGLQQLSSGDGATCGVFAGGEVRCWGSNWFGHLGTAIPTGVAMRSPTPVALPDLTGAVSVRLTRYGACALRTDNTLWCWAQEPTVGDGMTRMFTTPRQTFDRVLEFAMTFGATCILRDDRSVWCTGDAYTLGTGVTTPGRYVGTPTQVPGLAGVQHLYGGGETMCAQLGPTDLRCWGIGSGTAQPSGYSSRPVPMVW